MDVYHLDNRMVTRILDYSAQGQLNLPLFPRKVPFLFDQSIYFSC
jgi:hypothetical protein